MGRREEAPGREEAGAALLLLVEKKRERVVRARDSEEARNGRGLGLRRLQSEAVRFNRTIREKLIQQA